MSWAELNVALYMSYMIGPGITCRIYCCYLDALTPPDVSGKISSIQGLVMYDYYYHVRTLDAV